METERSAIESERFRYALYLIPPYEVARQVAEVHSILNKQFGLLAASKFQVHATLKGFFKCNNCNVKRLVAKLDPLFQAETAIPIQFNGFHIDDVGFGLDISRLDGQPNRRLEEFRERVVEAIFPFIAPDCDFVQRDLGAPYLAHITLAFRDIRPEGRESVLSYMENAALPVDPFLADTFHLLEFSSQDWAGGWEATLTWRLLHYWRLRSYRVS